MYSCLVIYHFILWSRFQFKGATGIHKFRQSLQKRFLFFFFYQVVLPVSLTSSSITTHVSSKEFVQMVSFLPSPRRMSTPCMYWLFGFFFKPLPWNPMGLPTPHPSLPHARLLTFIFLKSNKTRGIEVEANWLCVYGFFEWVWVFGLILYLIGILCSHFPEEMIGITDYQ